MKVAVRVDSSLQIGTGHVMRCLALANELKKHGADVSFVMRPLSGHIGDRVAEQGFSVLWLPQNSKSQPGTELAHSHWLEVSQDQDAIDTLGVLPGGFDWLVVDHYALDRKWEKRVRESKSCKLLIIDDLADREHFCDLLVDQGENQALRTRYRTLAPEATVMAGSMFAILRDEFRLERALGPRVRKEVKRIFVFFGGVDPTNETEKCLKALAASGVWERVEVVVGPTNPNAEALRLKYSRLPWMHFHIGTTKIAQLMNSCDLAIGAGGVTSLERVCLGLPSLVMAIAENQVPGSEALHQKGVLSYLGKSSEVSSSDIEKAVENIVKHPDNLRDMEQRSLSLVDGLGCERIIRAMGIKRQ